jgi:hypothetical protein
MKSLYILIAVVFCVPQISGQIKIYTEEYDQAGSYIISSLSENKLIFARTGFDADTHLGSQIVEMDKNLNFEKVFNFSETEINETGLIYAISTLGSGHYQFLYATSLETDDFYSTLVYACVIDKNLNNFKVIDSFTLINSTIVDEPKFIENDNQIIYYMSLYNPDLGFSTQRLIINKNDLLLAPLEQVDLIDLPVSGTSGPQFLDSIGTDLYFSDGRPLYQISNDTVLNFYYFSWLVQGSFIKSIKNIDLYKSGNDLIVCGPTKQENGEDHFGIGHIFFDELIPTNLENEVDMLFESGEESWNGHNSSIFSNDNGEVWAVGSSTDIRAFQFGDNDYNTNIYAVKLTEDLRDTAFVKIIEMEGHAYAWNGHVDNTGNFYITGIINDYQVDDRNKAFIIKITDDGIVSNKTIDSVFLDLTISPNPAQHSLSIKNALDARYTIVDALGRILKTGMVYDNEESIDISNLIAGQFFIQLFKDDSRLTKKFVKME